MKSTLATLVLVPLVITACGSPSESEYGDTEYQPPRPAPETAAPGEDSPYVPTEQQAQQWAEASIHAENADAEMEALEQEILGDEPE